MASAPSLMHPVSEGRIGLFVYTSPFSVDEFPLTLFDDRAVSRAVFSPGTPGPPTHAGFGGIPPYFPGSSTLIQIELLASQWFREGLGSLGLEWYFSI